MRDRSSLDVLDDKRVTGTWGLFTRKLRTITHHADFILERHGDLVPASLQETIRHTLSRLGDWTLKLCPSGKPLTLEAPGPIRAEGSELRRALTLLAQLESGAHAIRRMTAPPPASTLDSALCALVGEIDGLRTICRIRTRQIADAPTHFDDSDEIVTLH